MNEPRPDAEPLASPWFPASRWLRLLLLGVGLVAGQVWLYGPALAGRKILLPLDLLALPNVYLPAEQAAGIAPQDVTLSDLVLQFETERRFAAAEYRKGNVPLWLPYQYVGSPLVWPRYSPFSLLATSTESPLILPWVELLAALVAGGGAYAFCRRSLKLGYWPAVWAGWSYPLTGFFVLWQGFPTSGAVYWFPWLLLAVERVVAVACRRDGDVPPTGNPMLSLVLLAVVTALVLVSGHVDVAGQTLVGAGLYGLWCLSRHARGERAGRRWRRGAVLLGAGWILGFALAAPHVWPLMDYAPSGARMERRIAGSEERPPAGLSALVQTVLPDVHGTNRRGSLWLEPGNQIESAAAGYAGLFAALFLAPLAWGSLRHRAFVLCWLVLGALGLCWCLNVPGIVSALRLPGLNLFSHNRLVFLTGFAVTVLAAIGLEELLGGGVRWRRWHGALLAVLLVLSGWCAFRSQVLPEPVASRLAEMLQQGKPTDWVHTPADVGQLKAWFEHSYLAALALGVTGAGLWVALGIASRWPRLAVGAVALLALGEVAWNARGRRPLCDPSLYFPRLPLPEHLAKAEPGRIVGYGCFVPTLSQTHGLNDVRGYDSVDPARITDLLLAIRDPQSLTLPYALTQWFVPKIAVMNGRDLTLSPVLDMLGVRSVVFLGTPPPQLQPPIVGGGYWALLNQRALPRVFVPARIAIEADRAARIRRVTAEDFNPRDLAVLEPPGAAVPAGRGEGRVVAESPNHVTVEARMQAGGLLVLGDAWSEGWKATVNGAPASVHCVNHCLRGVVVPAGVSTVEFRYLPRGVVGGCIIAGCGALVLLGGMAVGLKRR